MYAQNTHILIQTCRFYQVLKNSCCSFRICIETKLKKGIRGLVIFYDESVFVTFHDVSVSVI